MRAYSPRDSKTMLSPRPRRHPWPKLGNPHRQSAKFVVGTTTVSNRNRYPNFSPWPTSQSSAGAFATGSLGWVSEFHLSPASTPAVELLLAFLKRGMGGCARSLRRSGSLGTQIKARPPYVYRLAVLFRSAPIKRFLQYRLPPIHKAG